MKTAWLIVGSLALGGASACSSSDSKETASADDYDDVAQALSGVMVNDKGNGEAGSLYDSVQIAVGTPPLTLVASASGHFEGRQANFAYTYAATCLDANGAEQNVCNLLDTDAATVAVHWSGDLDTTHLDASVDHDAQLHITQLQSAAAHISGDGNFELDAHFESAWRNVERNFHLG
jgi:hypothetical protein